jgi:hypothetical protein
VLFQLSATDCERTRRGILLLAAEFGVGCPEYANSFVADVEIKMNNLASLFLETDAAKRQLAESFQSERLLAAVRRPTAILGDDSRRAAGRYVQQDRRSFGSCRLQSALARIRTGIAPLARKPPQYKRDMSVSSFLLVLVFVGVALVAFTDRSPDFSPFHPPVGATPPAPRVVARCPECSPSFVVLLNERKL